MTDDDDDDDDDDEDDDDDDDDDGCLGVKTDKHSIPPYTVNVCKCSSCVLNHLIN